MKVKNIYLLLALLSLLLIQCNKANLIKKDTDILKQTWMIAPINCYGTMIPDTTTNPHSYLSITRRNELGIISRFISVYKQNKSNSGVNIKLRYKTEKCKDLSVIVTSIGECEKINSIDTIPLQINEKWQDSLLNIKIDEHTFFLNISLAANGIKDEFGKVWLSKFEYDFVSKNIFCKFFKIEKKEEIAFNEKDLVSWNNSNISLLPFFNKKILAIGETVHGAKTLNDIAISIIKERILKKQCKAILLEIPIELSFYINRYVNNDNRFKLEHISKEFERTLYSESTLSFIKWIREYNKTNQQKVFFLGFDIGYIEMKSRVDFFNFLYTLNSTLQNKDIKKICKKLILRKEKNTTEKVITEKERIGAIIKMFKNNKQLSKVFTHEELILINSYLELTKETSESYFRFVNRDKYMEKIITSIIDNIIKQDETITIFGHFGHLNYLTSQSLFAINYFAAGYYLKNKYKNDYSCIALLANQGKVMLGKTSKNFGVFNLDKAPPNSLEYQINSFNKDSVYLSMDKFNCSNIFKERLNSNTKIKDSFQSFFIPKSRIDGVLFVKNVENINKSKEVLKKNLNYNHISITEYTEILNKVKSKTFNSK